ncbi:MAG: sodium:solute symporter family transporter [Butyricicoccaceae bacterium]
MSGISAGWIGIGLAIGTYLNWLLAAAAAPVHQSGQATRLTLPESLLKNRFHDESGWISAHFGGIHSGILPVLHRVRLRFLRKAVLVRFRHPVSGKIALTVGAVVVISYTAFAGGFSRRVLDRLLPGSRRDVLLRGCGFR